MNVKELRHRAAEIMEERGLADGVYLSQRTGKCCAVGALCLATDPEMVTPNRIVGYFDDLFRQPVIQQAVTEIVNELELSAPDDGIDAVIHWSDNQDDVKVVAAGLRGKEA